jgi:hypothetical protein
MHRARLRQEYHSIGFKEILETAVRHARDFPASAPKLQDGAAFKVEAAHRGQ